MSAKFIWLWKSYELFGSLFYQQFQKHDQIRSTATPLRRDVSSLQLPPTLTPKRSQFYFNIWIFFCKREVVVCRLGSQTVAVPVIFHEFWRVYVIPIHKCFSPEDTMSTPVRCSGLPIPPKVDVKKNCQIVTHRSVFWKVHVKRFLFHSLLDAIHKRRYFSTWTLLCSKLLFDIQYPFISFLSVIISSVITHPRVVADVRTAIHIMTSQWITNT